MPGSLKHSRRVVSFAVSALILAHPGGALACFTAPEEVFLPADTLVDHAEAIYLAQVISAKLIHPASEKTFDNPDEPSNYPDAAEASDMDRLMQWLQSPHHSDRIEFKLAVIERIAGPDRDLLTLEIDLWKLRGASHFSEFNDFNSHKQDTFWKRDGGRTGIGTDCSVTPVFEVGRIYLVFPDTDHVKAYELILDPDDKWLRFVRERKKLSQRKE